MKPSSRMMWLVVRVAMLGTELALIVWGFYLIGANFGWWIMWSAIALSLVNTLLTYVQDDMRDKGDL